MASAGTPARARPTTVTLASALLYTLGALQLISVAITAMSIGPTEDAIRDLLGDDPAADTSVTAANISIFVGVAFGVLFGLGYIVLGALIGRGSNVARIITWVVTGLSVCCGSFGLLGLAAGGLLGGDTEITDGVTQADLQERIQSELPSWSQPVSITLAVLSLLGAIAVIILLVLRPSNEFFRKRQEPTWEPPVPGSQFPPPSA